MSKGDGNPQFIKASLQFEMTSEENGSVLALPTIKYYSRCNLLAKSKSKFTFEVELIFCAKVYHYLERKKKIKKKK
jgi:hypothetical protein